MVTNLPDARDQIRQLLLRGPARGLAQAAVGPRAGLVLAGWLARDAPFSDSLLARLQPKLILVTDAKQPATQRASLELRDRLDRSGAQVLYGRETGAVTIRFKAQAKDGALIRWETRF